MNKPEKKDTLLCQIKMDGAKCVGDLIDAKEEKIKAIHYNQGIEDYEKFLPSEEEILMMIKNSKLIFLTDSRGQVPNQNKILAKAIAKRIGK